jgi:putative addiction module component (TIGR02574 family)
VGVQRLIEVKIWARPRVLREAMQSIEQLTKEILSLPSVSRALLAEKLVESLEFDTDPTIQSAWVTEAKRRRDEVRNGSVTPIPGEEALAQVRQLLE